MKLNIKTKYVIVALIALFSLVAGCGGSGPPLSIPAPTGGYITVSAPNPEGRSLVFGYIMVNEVPQANVEVVITNTNTSGTTTTTADEAAFFSTQIEASLNDVINVQYRDPTTERLSDATGVAAGNETQPMTTINIIPQDIDLGSDGYAYIVGNDGTDSEIVELDIVNKMVTRRALFTGVTFDKVAVFAGESDHLAVLATATDKLYWFNSFELADDVAPVSEIDITDPTDVAVAEVDDGAIIDNTVIVSVRSTTVSIRFYTIDPTEEILVAAGTFCFAHPDDAAGTTIAACSGGDTYQPVEAEMVAAITVASVSDPSRIAVIATYNDGTTAYQWGYLTDGGGGTVTIDTTAGALARSYAASFVAGATAAPDPNRMTWYNTGLLLFTDLTNSTINMLEEDCTGTCAINEGQIAAGMQVFGIAADAAGQRAFASGIFMDDILGVTLADAFDLNDQEIDAHVGPTDLVYHSDGSSELIAVILPQSAVTKILNAAR